MPGALTKQKGFEIHANVIIHVCEMDPEKAQRKAISLLSAVAEDVEIISTKGENNDEVQTV